MQHSYGYFEEDQLGQIGDAGLWGRIMRFIAPYWCWVTPAVLLALIITASGLALPYFVRTGIDRFIVNDTLPSAERIKGLTTVSLQFLVVMLIGFGANFFQVILLEWTGQNIMHAMRQHLFTRTLDLNLSFFNRNPVGKLVTRLTNDIQNMYEMFTSVIVTLFNEFVRLAGIMAILFWMNWYLGLILSAMIPLMILLTILFGRLARDAFRDIRSHLAQINAFLQEGVSGISIVQLFLREKDMYRNFTDLNYSYFGSTLYQIKVFGIFMPAIDILYSLSLALIIWVGGGQIIQDRMTLGDLTAFISYMRLFFQPLRELAQKYSIVQSAMASAERIFQLMDTKETLPVSSHPVIPLKIEGKIEFREVTFGYDPQRPVVHDLSFQVSPGETLAVVGATGSGKTTLINLLERFYDPDKGSIHLDGTDLRKLDPYRLRRKIGLVMQEVFIVPGTVRENILLDGKMPEKGMKNIIELSQLSDLLEHLPRGLETRIGEGGTDLSAGQRQLLAFARVLARDPRILVLDEATANVDTETEMLIEQAIQAALANRTSIVIAHRLSTIRRANRILVMDRGRIVETGTHESLMDQRGLYYDLQILQNGVCQAEEVS